MKHRRCIYEMKSGREEISSEIYDNSIAEQSERAAMEQEIRDPKSHVQGFRFELVDDKNVQGFRFELVDDKDVLNYQ